MGEANAAGRKIDPKRSVAILTCSSYVRKDMQEAVHGLLAGLSFSPTPGAKVFLKPNLVTASRGELACTNPQFVACLAEWFVERGALVSVGDSPAFGSSRDVLRASGITAALQGLPVTIPELKKKRKVRLNCGIDLALSTDMLDCDLLINLPKVKAHSQMLVSMAVKNLFGAVLGCRKAMAHMRYGAHGTFFETILVDLLAVLPVGLSVLDGVVAMHKRGPVNGEAFELGVVAASTNAVALDTAMLQVLGISARRSPLWQECKRRGLEGVGRQDLIFPLERPESVQAAGFVVPATLDPVRFQIGRFLKNGIKRVCLHNYFSRKPNR